MSHDQSPSSSPKSAAGNSPTSYIYLAPGPREEAQHKTTARREARLVEISRIKGDFDDVRCESVEVLELELELEQGRKPAGRERAI